MAIKMVIGLPGMGKSYYATRKILAALLREWKQRGAFAREFVVSVELVRGEVARFLRRHKCPLEGSNLTICHKRDRRLRRFWRIRGRNKHLVVTETEDKTNPDKEGAKLYQFRKDSDFDRGVVYWVDEGQFMFRARDYGKLSGEAQDYLSYHEHLNDEVAVLTQDPKQMDCAFTRLTEEFIWMVNGCRRRLFGWFRMGKSFVANHYWHYPEDGDVPDQCEPVRFDKKVAACYRSSELGSRGENDKGGIHWAWLCVPVLLVSIIGYGVYSFIRGKVESFSRSTPAAASAPGSTNDAEVVQGFPSLHRASSTTNRAPAKPQVESTVAFQDRAVAGMPVAKKSRILSYWGRNGDLWIQTSRDYYHLLGAIAERDTIVFNGQVFKVGGEWIE